MSDCVLNRTIADGFQFRNLSRIRVRTGSMLHMNGYGAIEQVPAQVQDAAERIARHAEAVFEPAIAYRCLTITHVDPDDLTLETGTSFRCESFASALKDCSAIEVVVLTMGGQFDREVEKLSADYQLLDLLLFETAGWLGIEEATKAFVTQFRAWANEHGYRLTRRLAPGYDKWPLTGQRWLFSLFDEARLPVRLLESCAMVPKMSRSALYGLRR